MYNLIQSILQIPDHAESYVVYTSCLLLAVLTVVFLDLLYRIFRHIWR